ncbi:hypothetical protein GKZ75_08450 [Kocuria indica]|uniref:Uncharacterized protein n=1 Tax=Kocuria marina subsp. indica TaxID=1049583 RepID=A0A6N9QYD3_9MICC|nr:hypothetical protein [Kocuria indica]NDO78252.1 hypothetical protein [Kocuria indica]
MNTDPTITYGYEYTRPDGTIRAVTGFPTRREAATYLGHSLHDNRYTTKAAAQQISRVLHATNGPIIVSGITARIIREEA